MRLSHLAEPELEFGSGLRHPDIRFGIMDYDPFDVHIDGAQSRVKLGIVGSADTIEGTARWIEACSDSFEAMPSRQVNLFPRFSDLRNDEIFRCEFTTSSELQRILVSASRH